MLPIRSEPTRPPDASPREESSRGQYMVEFALSFSIFVIFVLIVIDLGLLIYNHNLFYHGVSKGARAASLGASNPEIKDAVSREVVPSYFPTMLLVAEPEPVTITPDREMHRVDGRQVTVRMDARFGMSMLWFGNVTVGFPIRSSSVIIQNNDQDRDGCKDSLEAPAGASSGPECDSIPSPFDPAFDDAYRQDHFNNDDQDSDAYLFGGDDIDADSGANPQDDREGADTVVVGYFHSGVLSVGDTQFAIYRGDVRFGTCGSAGSLGSGVLDGTSWEDCFDGTYHAPELWSGGIEHPASLFPQSLPTRHVDRIGDVNHPGYDTRVLHAVYDADNDGWEDKYDADPIDPTVHRSRFD